MIADAVEHIPKTHPQYDKSHVCAYGTAART